MTSRRSAVSASSSVSSWRGTPRSCSYARVDIAELRAAWERALEKDRPRDAIKALVELEKLEPLEPLWSQRLGEAYRREGDSASAVEAFVHAFERYHAKGFIPRALAMAKLVRTFDAKRGERMERSLPEPPRRGPPPLP